MRETERHALLERLEHDALLRREGDSYRTTKRWQGAMMRAASQLYAAGDPGDDLRVPVALALVDVYGLDAPDDDIASMVAVMAPIEARELGEGAPASTRAGGV